MPNDPMVADMDSVNSAPVMRAQREVTARGGVGTGPMSDKRGRSGLIVPDWRTRATSQTSGSFQAGISVECTTAMGLLLPVGFPDSCLLRRTMDDLRGNRRC
jgi:hypothetical protein